MAVTIDWDEPDVDAAAHLGVTRGAAKLLDDSDQIVPIEDGDLVESGDTEVVGNRGEVFYDSDHAIKQHEDLEYKHPRGGQAKFLENALTNNAAAIVETMCEPIRDALR